MTPAERAASLRLAIREELIHASAHHPETIRIVADTPLREIARKMEIAIEEAFEMRKACRKHIAEQWVFEDEGGVGQDWNK